MTTTMKVFHVNTDRMEAVVCKKQGHDCPLQGHSTDPAAVQRAIERAMEPYLHVSFSKRQGARYLSPRAKARL